MSSAADGMEAMEDLDRFLANAKMNNVSRAEHIEVQLLVARVYSSLKSMSVLEQQVLVLAEAVKPGPGAGDGSS